MTIILIADVATFRNSTWCSEIPKIKKVFVVGAVTFFIIKSLHEENPLFCIRFYEQREKISSVQTILFKVARFF